MKKRIRIVILNCLLFLLGNNGYAQTSTPYTDPLKSIALNTYVISETDTAMPKASWQTLELKLRQIANKNGTGAVISNRFIITANISVLSKDITATAPPMIALSLEVNLFIGDGKQGKKFASKTLSVKGVGTNETKAYNNAISNIKADDPQIQNFVLEGKQKIINYFDTKCNEVVKEATVYASLNQYEDAISTLSLVPSECKECFDKCLKELGPMYKRYTHNKCQAMLVKSKALWAASPNEKGADSAAAILGRIDINADLDCEKDINQLIAEISKAMKDQKKKDWDFKMKDQKHKVEMANDIINNCRQIAIEYAKGHYANQSINIQNW